MTISDQTLQVEYRPIGELIPYARNARTHSDAQVAQIAASIREFGFTNPVLLDGDRGIIAGHGRVLAARKLRMESVPCIEIGWMSEAQKRAYILADNQLAITAGWDKELLALELADLKGLAFDLPLIGFNEAELATLLRNVEQPAEGLTDPDDAPDMPKEVWVQPGDLFVLGEHRVLCGDATDSGHVARLVGEQRAALAFTDPPYNVAYQGGAPGRRKKIANDDLGDGFYGFLVSVAKNLLAVTDGACYVCMSSSELHTLQRAFLEAGGHWSTFVVWAKDNFTLGHADYQRQFEPIWYGWREGTKHFWCGGRDQGDVWSVPKPRVNPLHPTQKPVALAERAIGNSSRPGDVVLDLFLGSGSTLIAAERLGRACYGMELDPAYVQVVLERWEAHTGRTAAKVGGDGAGAADEATPAERRGRGAGGTAC